MPVNLHEHIKSINFLTKWIIMALTAGFIDGSILPLVVLASIIGFQVNRHNTIYDNFVKNYEE